MGQLKRQESAPADSPKDYEGEIFQFAYHMHWIRLVGPVSRLVFLTAFIVISGILLLSGPALRDSVTNNAVVLLLLLIFLIVQLSFVARLYRHLLTLVVVTDVKVHHIKKTLLWINEHQSMDLWVLQDIDKSQRGPLQNLLGFGTIRLFAQDTEMRLHFTPRISEKYDRFMALREKARARAFAAGYVNNGQTNGNHRRTIDAE